MLRLRSSVPQDRADDFSAILGELPGVHRVVRQDDELRRPERCVFVADVEPNCADRLVEEIAGIGIAPDDYVLTKMEVVAPQRHLQYGEAGDGFSWIEVLGEAQANSRPLARYLALINVAAVIAALGVITSSPILIVGAMAVSPDLLPICATSVGLVRGDRRLSRRAFGTLVLGLGLVVVTAAVLSAVLSAGGLLPEGFDVDRSSLSNLAVTDYSTVLIALAAGIAGMLAFETRASQAVGVAISVTTIPASAYLGVAIGGGGIDHALGALVVLAVNVSLLILSGTLTLLVQRTLPNRSGAPL